MTRKKDQLCLPFPNDADALMERLRLLSGRDFSLVVTDNATSMLSVRGREGRLVLRLHRMFLQAGEDVIGELVRFLKGSRSDTPRIRAFIREHRGFIRERGPKRQTVRTEGRHHDLSAIAKSVNDQYFNGSIRAEVTWGISGGRRSVRRRTLGSYSSRTGLIRINPILDKKAVPRYFIEFIVYHEMLHADMGTVMSKGRRSVHSKEFRMRERRFAEYEKALAWEKWQTVF